MSEVIFLYLEMDTELRANLAKKKCISYTFSYDFAANDLFYIRKS